MSQVKVVRTIDCTRLGNRFREGPVVLNGARVASIQAQDVSPAGMQWLSAVFNLKGEIGGGNLVDFPTPVVIDASGADAADVGSATSGAAPYPAVDGDVETIESGTLLRVTLYLSTQSL